MPAKPFTAPDTASLPIFPFMGLFKIVKSAPFSMVKFETTAFCPIESCITG